MAKAIEWDWRAHLGDKDARMGELFDLEERLETQLGAARAERAEIEAEAKALAKAANARVKPFKL